ncbi:MAG: hypothetical protein ACR2NJ_04185, partial [Acidimicrobiales bacterium]
MTAASAGAALALGAPLTSGGALALVGSPGQGAAPGGRRSAGVGHPDGFGGLKCPGDRPFPNLPAGTESMPQI